MFLKKLLKNFLTSAIVICSIYTHSADNLLFNGNFDDNRYISDWKARSGKLSTGHSDNVLSKPNSALLKASFNRRYKKYQCVIDNRRPNLRVVPGEKYIFKVYAKGTGTLQLGLFRYGNNPLKLKGMYPILSKKYALNSSWQCCSLEYTVKDPKTLEIFPRCILTGKDSNAYLDNAELIKLADSSYSIKATPENPMAYPGQNIELKFQLLKADKGVSGKLRLDLRNIVKKSKPVALKTNSSGIASYSLKIPANCKLDQKKISVFNTDSGQGRQLFVDIVSPTEYNTMARIAKNMKKPASPTTVLVIGDSLSDLFRGHNYVDKLNYWCELNSPGKLSFRNYGVRGDYITRVLRRIKGQKTWGWLRYKSILSPKPDVVLLFLGQNDSRLLKKSNFKIPKVTLENFQTDYLQLISILRKNNPKVNIVILTPVSIYEQAVKEKWNKRKRSYDLFGDPATMLKFKKAVNTIAEKSGCGVIEIFTPTHNAANRKDLFISDGVHLSDEGNNLVAKEIMKYFKSNQWNKN